MDNSSPSPSMRGPINEQHVTLSPPLVSTHPKWIIFIFYCATMAVVVLAWTYYYIVLALWWMIFLLPLEIVGLGVVFTLTSLFLVKIAVLVLEKKCPPSEGLFPRNGKEMHYFEARSFFKYYAIWLTRSSMFPWIDKIAYKMLGVPVGKTVVLHEAWVDPELVDIGDYCMVGMNSTVMSHCLYQDAFLTKKTVIKENTVIGAYAVIAPGNSIGSSSVIGANSSTNLDSKTEDGYMYGGNPVRQLKKIE
ncbi:MAG TPA: hypothetical protein VKM55_11940 [Candidatus Lokiarchaeia archaeon]|nr:hypothetical protein [Candidatus Lokiarchaeia archaeon]